ncbi:MAG: DUF4159 domain-containing protein [Planctomycetales bacterium]|nr:DUF4159 domain-containing protein [Planctomycetales bacterium]
MAQRRDDPRPALDAGQVNQAIQRGIAFLKKQQDPRTGEWHWELDDSQPGGVTALCTLALLNSGVDRDDPVLTRGLAAVRRPASTMKTYTVALKTMVLCAADPETDRPLIRNYVTWLQRNQVANDNDTGGWGYLGGGTADPSNTQYAMMALYEAERVGVEVQDIVWRRALGYWTRLQLKDSGAWKYTIGDSASGSMTCAGIASTIIALGQVTEADARIRGDVVECCQPQMDESIPLRGLEWLAKHFSVSGNPASSGRNDRTSNATYYHYYMYGVERIGRMTANRFIGQHDWYREGAEILLRSQDPISGAWKGIGIESSQEIATSLSLLFLAKGRRPVVACKLKVDDEVDWNRHRHDLANLTADVERRWKRDLSWQVIDSRAATLEDLLQTPVLYLSGRDGLNLTADQKQLLKKYVEHGGFVFAVRCCDGAGFDRDFRQLMVELFPDNELRLLPPDHPIWYAEQPIPAEHVMPLYGLDACCRTSIVYCPEELSGYWEVGNVRTLLTLDGKVKNSIQARLAIGANVLTYATNRELKEKLDAPRLTDNQVVNKPFERGTLYVAKLQHGGGSDDAPAALRNLMEMAGQQLNQRVGQETHLLAVDSAKLFEYPILFTHGRRRFHFTPAERVALATYLKRGGFLMADAICANQEFVDAFRGEMKAILPDNPLQPIPPTHAMWTQAYQGYDVTRVQLHNPRRGSETEGLATRQETIAPAMEGIEIDGRLAVVFSPYDLSCALENQASIECKGYPREDAAKLGINILLYAMQE